MLYDIADDKHMLPFGTSGAWVVNLVFSQDGKTLVTASPCGQVKFWKIPTGEELGTLDFEENVAIVRLTADNDTLITASWDGVVRFWPIASASEVFY